MRGYLHRCESLRALETVLGSVASTSSCSAALAASAASDNLGVHVEHEALYDVSLDQIIS